MNSASIPNPMLAPFAVLVGEWKTVGTHPMLPGITFHGRCTFQWIEGGAFLLMRSDTDEPQIPNGVAIFGSDDAAGKFFMLYFDEREVSRKYDVAVEKETITWWRDNPEFAQRFTWTLVNDGNTIISQGEMRRNEKNWEKDLQLTFTKVK